MEQVGYERHFAGVREVQLHGARFIYRVGRVYIGISFTSTGADLLTDLTGLTSLETVGSLTLTGLNSLPSLAGIPNLSTVGDLELSNPFFRPDLTVFSSASV